MSIAEGYSLDRLFEKTCDEAKPCPGTSSFDPGDYCLLVGRHKGKQIKEIFETDFNYLLFLYEGGGHVERDAVTAARLYLDSTPKIEKAKRFTLTFGKHKNRKLIDIWQTEPQYIYWLGTLTPEFPCERDVSMLAAAVIAHFVKPLLDVGGCQILIRDRLACDANPGVWFRVTSFDRTNGDARLVSIDSERPVGLTQDRAITERWRVRQPPIPHVYESMHGISIWRGIVVLWDEDHDTRILRWIDSLPEEVRSGLVQASEANASLSLGWRWTVPRGLEEGVSVAVMGDSWVISQSVGTSRPDGDLL